MSEKAEDPVVLTAQCSIDELKENCNNADVADSRGNTGPMRSEDGRLVYRTIGTTFC